MPANTPKGYPYPVGTDRLMDGDDAIHNLATAVDTFLGVAASGTAVTAVPGALNTPVSVAVTFPAGRFTVAPVVLATPQATSPQVLAPATAAIATTTGVVLWGARVSGGLGAVTICWLAIQI